MVEMDMIVEVDLGCSGDRKSGPYGGPVVRMLPLSVCEGPTPTDTTFAQVLPPSHFTQILYSYERIFARLLS